MLYVHMHYKYIIHIIYYVNKSVHVYTDIDVNISSEGPRGPRVAHKVPAHRGPRVPGPQGPRRAHKNLAHQGPGGPQGPSP